jgi:hypothetical protein
MPPLVLICRCLPCNLLPPWVSSGVALLLVAQFACQKPTPPCVDLLKTTCPLCCAGKPPSRGVAVSSPTRVPPSPTPLSPLLLLLLLSFFFLPIPSPPSLPFLVNQKVTQSTPNFFEGGYFLATDHRKTRQWGKKLWS